MRILWVQILAVLSLGLLSGLTQKEFFSASFIGASISALANIWFMWIVFRPKLGAAAQKMVVSFYLGAVSKWVLTALLFLLAFKQVEFLASPGNAALMIATFGFLQILQAALYTKMSST